MENKLKEQHQTPQQLPKVLSALQKDINKKTVINWGKGTGGPYPWSKSPSWGKK